MHLATFLATERPSKLINVKNISAYQFATLAVSMQLSASSLSNVNIAHAKQCPKKSDLTKYKFPIRLFYDV